MRTLAALAAAALLFTACADNTPEASDASNPQPENVASDDTQVVSTEETDLEDGHRDDIADRLADGDLDTGPGVYTFDYQGATGTLTIPTPADHEAVLELDAFRAAAGGQDVTWIVAEVDNTQGVDVVNMYSVVVIGDDGDQIEATSVADRLYEWSDRLDPSDTTRYNWSVDLSNANSFYLHPGAKGTAVLATDRPVESVARVFVYPAGGFDRVDAFKES